MIEALTAIWPSTRFSAEAAAYLLRVYSLLLCQVQARQCGLPKAVGRLGPLGARSHARMAKTRASDFGPRTPAQGLIGDLRTGV